jgi:pyruvate,orthophosphate dikinase
LNYSFKEDNLIQSKALEVNLASYHVEVEIDPKYEILQEVLAKYYGLMEGLTTFLKELSHPRRNLQFIVNEARGYCLKYFHLIKNHNRGPDAAGLFMDIFIDVLISSPHPEVRTDAVDNLLLFIQKVIKECGPDHILRFMPAMDQIFDRIRTLPEDTFFLFVKSYYRMEKLGEVLAAYSEDAAIDHQKMNLLLIKYFQSTYAYWLGETNPLEWFVTQIEEADEQDRFADIFDGISHKRIQDLKTRLREITDTPGKEFEQNNYRYQFKELLMLPGYNQIVDLYRDIPGKLLNAGGDQRQGNRWKVIFLFHMMNVSGLSLIHEETLRDINRTISWLISHEKYSYIETLIRETFAILKPRSREFPLTALSIVLNMGKGIYKTDESDLVKFFILCLMDLGFHAPMISGVGNDWQIRMNPAHIQNIRVWLELIELNPRWSTRLLSDLIIHLSLTGVFIKDTDLFPRDITQLLNSGMGPVYNLVKQLAKLFPVYFNDIGAEGELRDISTRLDEITHRKDPLVHFLRKQTHVESSNRVVSFIEAVINFWTTKEKKHIEPFVPPNIYEQINTDGPDVDGVNRALSHLKDKKGIALPDHLLTLGETELKQLLDDAGGVFSGDICRLVLAARMYKLLHSKYSLVMGLESCDEIECYLSQLKTEAFPNLNNLRTALEEKSVIKKLSLLLAYLDELKTLILSDQVYERREDIYKKRHFTVDIPSMYGSYHEMKFDALGLTFRIESVVNVCFEEIVEGLDLTLITREAFFRIYDLLQLFYRALKIDGISSVEFESQLDLLSHALKTRGFTFTQYLDIFKGFARAVTNVINDYFNNVHENNLNRILASIPWELLLDKYLPQNDTEDFEQVHHRISEIFFRDKIGLSLGLKQLDLFLTRVLNTLFHQSSKLPDTNLRLLLNYDPQRAMTDITGPDERAVGIIHLGNKGNNLVKLHRLGFPIPPGFIITTEVFRCRDIIESYEPAAQNFKDQVARRIKIVELITGKKFGNPQNPLLFSVRSGSSISQPGMMDTFLNVGINEEIAEGTAYKTKNPWFAWDNFRRFMQCYGMAFGLQRDDFDTLMRDFKKMKAVSVKREFSGAEMKSLALIYKKRIMDEGVEVLDDPIEQLMLTIKKVLNSWESPKARVYRKIMGISDDWGTAVTVQSMVYGNFSPTSGTGVIFTHNPKWSEDNLRLWGDFTIGNQGEDVVAGLVTTLPISLIQQENEMRDTDVTLETHFPDIYKTLKDWAGELIYTRGWTPQEIEFTFESPRKEDLYLLQTRNMAIRERKDVLVFDFEDMGAEPVLLGNGIGVSGGAMSGRAVFTLDEIARWREKEPETSLILLRGDTVPDDIEEINASDGLLTARGGMTSHAAVVAHRLGKTCVVGCGTLVCNEKRHVGYFDQVPVASGDFLSIDGQDGVVYQGMMKVKRT